jgi:outer membrane murein-binding lipoprotein Lpp
VSARRPWIIGAFVLACVAAGCKSGSTARQSGADAAEAATKLTDLSTSLEAIRADFNAHKKEARFIALLSPA